VPGGVVAFGESSNKISGVQYCKRFSRLPWRLRGPVVFSVCFLLCCKFLQRREFKLVGLEKVLYDYIILTYVSKYSSQSWQ
jgi:hypothetical protein